jgi:hypothetical protein
VPIRADHPTVAATSGYSNRSNRDHPDRSIAITEIGIVFADTGVVITGSVFV